VYNAVMPRITSKCSRMTGIDVQFKIDAMYATNLR